MITTGTTLTTAEQVDISLALDELASQWADRADWGEDDAEACKDTAAQMRALSERIIAATRITIEAA